MKLIFNASDAESDHAQIIVGIELDNQLGEDPRKDAELNAFIRSSVDIASYPWNFAYRKRMSELYERDRGIIQGSTV